MLATALMSLGPIGITGFLMPLIMQSPTSAPVGLGLGATVAGVLAFSVSIFGFLLSPLSGRVSAAGAPAGP